MKGLRFILFALALVVSGYSYAGPVNVNTADAAAIAEAMSGVGLKKARAIVDYRNKNGAFKSLEELALVKGIGDKTVAKNRENLVLESNNAGN